MDDQCDPNPFDKYVECPMQSSMLACLLVTRIHTYPRSMHVPMIDAVLCLGCLGILRKFC